MKSQNWVETQAIVQSSLQKLVFGNSFQNLLKSRYQSFWVLSNFARFSCFSWFSCEYILSLIVDHRRKFYSQETYDSPILTHSLVPRKNRNFFFFVRNIAKKLIEKNQKMHNVHFGRHVHSVKKVIWLYL